MLKDIEKWLRFLGFNQVKEVPFTTLNNPKKIHAYHLSDEKNTSVSIAKSIGVSQPRVTEMWKEWMSLGIGESIPASGGSRFKKSFDLKMFGMKIPELDEAGTKKDIETTKE